MVDDRISIAMESRATKASRILLAAAATRRPQRPGPTVEAEIGFSCRCVVTFAANIAAEGESGGTKLLCVTYHRELRQNSSTQLCHICRGPHASPAFSPGRARGVTRNDVSAAFQPHCTVSAERWRPSAQKNPMETNEGTVFARLALSRRNLNETN
ncbi:hypothetical protein Q1695_000741 [Nippostrongylus brasiliensis]|nr:hypothetical protein Q1695_000741 [Nippostrongylus brasiliensis]